MTKILKEALAELSKLPDKEQDAIGEWLLKELASEQGWEQLFSESFNLLEDLAADALAERHSGRTKELDPEKL
jgi:hypothetical protein